MKTYKILQFVKGSERYGASVSIRNLSLELKRRGHDVSLLVHKGRSLGAPIREEKLRIIEIEPYKKFSLRGLLRLRNLLRREAPDILHTHLSDATLSGTIAARMCGVPSISTVHGMNKRWTYSFANRLIAVSEAGKQNLVRQGISSKQISVAYNGIPIPNERTAVKREQARDKLAVRPDAIVLSNISRADAGKGIQDALAAVAMVRRRLPNVQFFFAGEGDYLAELKKLAAALGMQSYVRFLGYVDDVFDLLAASDLFLFPSHREAMGISLVEAMAMGLPTVGSNVGGIPEVVDSESAVLVNSGDVPALADALISVCADAEARKRMGEHARKRVMERFSLPRSAEMVEDAYGLLLART